MLGKNKQASPLAIGEGKRVRRARNIIRRYGSEPDLPAKLARRLERAKAVMVRAALLGL